MLSKAKNSVSDFFGNMSKGVVVTSALAAAAGVAALVVYLRNRRRRAARNEQQKAQPKRASGKGTSGDKKTGTSKKLAKGSAKTGRSASSKTKEDPNVIWTAEQATAKMSQFLEVLSNGDMQSNKQLYNKLRTHMKVHIDKTTAPDSYRLAAATFLTYTSAYELLHLQDPRQLAAMEKTHQTDMREAWDLLDFEPSTVEGRKKADILRLDIAQRLHDRQKVLSVYNKILSRFDPQDENEVMTMFLSSPIVGRWSDFRRFAEIIKANPRTRLYMAPKGFLFPEHEALHMICNQQNDVDEKDLEWVNYSVKQMRIKLLSSSQQLGSDIPPHWADVPIEEECRLSRTGAIGQMASQGPVQAAMVGPMSDKSIFFCGLTDYQDPTTGGLVRQTLTYELAQESKRSQTITFTGKATISQNNLNDDGSLEPINELVFQMIMVIEQL